ncbi:MAG: hypothetical protein V7K67_24450 [Nostoc sp.]
MVKFGIILTNILDPEQLTKKGKSKKLKGKRKKNKNGQKPLNLFMEKIF